MKALRVLKVPVGVEPVVVSDVCLRIVDECHIMALLAAK